MKTYRSAVVALAVGLLAFTALGQKPQAEKGWNTDLAKAMKTAKAQKKLVMVDFNATWCGPCQMYKKQVFPGAAFKREAKNLVLVTIDTDEQPQLARRYGVQGIPDIRFITPEGKQVGQIVGFGGEESLIAEIRKARKAAKL